MKDPSVLIVAENDKQFQHLSRALQGMRLSQIRQARSGEEAVRYLDTSRCDVCVLSYELPGKRTGLDIMLDIRHHRPDLPVIIVSRSGSEKVAVEAFHARVVDYVPISRGYETAVASLIGRIDVEDAEVPVAPAQIIGAGIDSVLMQMTYQNRLRAIGRHLDLYTFRRANILEVEGGFVVRATSSSGRDIETLEFADQHFPQLLASCTASRGKSVSRKSIISNLLPTGYEDFMRVVGYLLDRHAAEAITISELDELVVIGGVGRVDESGNSRYGPLQWLMRQADVELLLNEAYSRRRDPRDAQGAKGDGLMRQLTN